MLLPNNQFNWPSIDDFERPELSGDSHAMLITKALALGGAIFVIVVVGLAAFLWRKG